MILKSLKAATSPIKEVERFRAGYNPASGTYKMTTSKVGERIDPNRSASYKPITRFSGSYAMGGKLKYGNGGPGDPPTGDKYYDEMGFDYNDPSINTSRFSAVKQLPIKNTLLDRVANEPQREIPAPEGNAPKLSLGEGLKGVAPYLSNIANSFRKLPTPIAPPMENNITPNLVNYDAERAAIDQDYRSFGNETDYRVANPTTAQAIKATGLARKIQGKNTLAQQEGNTNAFIKNQTAQANQAVGARNVERQREFNDQLLSRTINQQRLNSENLSNASDKFQQQERDNKLNSLEERKLGILPTLYKDTGVFSRNLSDLWEAERRKKGTSFSKGGTIRLAGIKRR